MKKINLFLSCAFNQIKKKFFKSEKTDINHACEQLKNNMEEINILVDEKHKEEYAQNYNLTTRWQTI
ncbi:hypothetical protein SLH46_11975 [Draconibacterium sp. IB214405]|uniref:hypothetical protein n=1 Tax=Draconibacterium sp. IB214405 TaxID=3097352 RepID=UPI002A14ECB4|nr:hypothetical protein [Draconibacterium sp. IB214405]MDX8339907.1 hypothetical protein [Draconibacterium sp. IB214405]